MSLVGVGTSGSTRFISALESFPQGRAEIVAKWTVVKPKSVFANRRRVPSCTRTELWYAARWLARRHGWAVFLACAQALSLEASNAR